MKKLLLFPILKILVKLILSRYKPKIVAVTGSVGKTSAKEAIFCVVSQKYRAARSKGNFNNEVGVPLTILGRHRSPGANIFKWILLFFSSMYLLLIKDKRYPEVLVLEMGADRPGDIFYLTSLAKPHVGVVTIIGQSHLQYFGTQEKIAREKLSIIRRNNGKDWAVLNADDPFQAQARLNPKGNLITFGQSESSDVQYHDVKISSRGGEYGTEFYLKYRGREEQVFVGGVLGWTYAQACATGLAVGAALGMSFEEMIVGFKNFVPSNGRSRILEGVKNTILIDDTYNAAPSSVESALKNLMVMPTNGHKIAVLGDMLELGATSESAHQRIGKTVADLNVDYLFVVGERSRDIARGARKAGMDEDRIYHFARAIEGGIFLQERIKEHDTILIKGSRGMKMEQVVYELMAKPWEADEVLVGKVVR